MYASAFGLSICIQCMFLCFVNRITCDKMGLLSFVQVHIVSDNNSEVLDTIASYGVTK